ncbi:hypothetical protein K4K53_000836 [Colletotrichum sp. SAR 10_77]|nr:hypothetical protein K4K52_002132 [Colletotrichum sp. SAR 10_76]KAI8248408.1 hypothetical protein K4K53_000836 [Colletotrichum sp. SAR 10_77]
MDRKQSSPMMPAFMVSAPGKVIVFGEHAVVHGKAAIAAAISLRSYLLVTSLSKSRRTVSLRFPDIDLHHTWNIDDLPWAAFQHPSKKKSYYDLVTELDQDLVAAIQPHLNEVSPHKPDDVRKVHQNSASAFLYIFLALGDRSFTGCLYTLRSTIPIGAGLGSSASIAVCLAAALLLQLRTLSGPHPDQPPDEARLQVERINRWAFVCEMCIHGNPSGVDNTVATQGKAVVFQRTDYNKPPAVRPLWDFPELPLLLVDTKQAKSTAFEVAKVAKLKSGHPKLVGSILDAIDKVTNTADGLIGDEKFDNKSEESLQQVGELMTINHGLLVSLGVSHPRLERIRELVDHEGIGWTKLTGAGGGGCSITLLKPDVPKDKLVRLETQLEDEGYEKFETTLGGDGVGVLWPAVLKNGVEDNEGGMEIDLDSFLNADGNEGVEKLVGVHGGADMPAKSKASSKAKDAENKSKQQTQAAAETQQPPKTINERSFQRYHQTNPHERRREEAGGLHALSPAERQSWVNASLVRRVANREFFLTNKAEREFWKQISRESPPIRRLEKPRSAEQKVVYDWGKDKNGRDLGDYPIDQFTVRAAKQAQLTALEVLHRRFLQRREFARDGVPDAAEGKVTEIMQEDIDEERKRRREMAALRKELYGEKMGPYATDPEWDDVVPIPAEEPEGALATIAYPEDYAEVMSYLRAVMVAEEYSPRCLRLTDHVISMNPAHYTVWLYRFKIVEALDISVIDEIEWLNEVSLEHIKNYQIWHHRQLLLDHHYNHIKGSPDEVKRFGRSETEFLTRMLDEDTKNYHVWSYRQYLVRKLGLWNLQELLSTQNWIEEDVRNNSAWSHRFFLVFSDPGASTEGSHATEHDPKVPADIVDREVKYVEEKALLAPQNQAAWNYLRGVLVKGGRKLETAEAFAAQFVNDIGEGEDKEEVRSTHALDFLADVYAEKGQKEEAGKYLDRLAEKWDPVRAGYWKYRKQQLA